MQVLTITHGNYIRYIQCNNVQNIHQLFSSLLIATVAGVAMFCNVDWHFLNKAGQDTSASGMESKAGRRNSYQMLSRTREQGANIATRQD